MAVTRSRISVVASENGADGSGITSVKVTKITKVTKKKTERKSAPASPKKRAIPKQHIEECFPVVDVPADLLLPSEFVDSHEPEFVDGVRHILKKDPTLYPCIVFQNFRAFAKREPKEETDDEIILRYWYSLISSVIGQQVSGHAAKAIEGRFRELFLESPTPKETLEKTTEQLRGAGLLGMKAKYVVSISEAFSSPESKLVSVDFYNSSTKEEIISELVQLKGIGEWSAKMFSIFTLKELDIFAYDDLGVARGVARYLENRPQLLKDVKEGVDAVEKLKNGLKKKGKFQTKSSKRDWTPLHDEYVKFLGHMFAPYQLVVMLIMWRLASTNVEILENVR